MPDMNFERIVHPAAWRSADIGGKAGLVLQMTESQLAAIHLLLDRTRRIPVQQVTARDFEHPDFDGLVGRIFEQIQHGRGAVILRGCSPDRHSEEDFERIFWGFGVHFGEPVSQSVLGDRIGHVRHTLDNPNDRAYRSLSELTPHTDNSEIVGLMSVKTGKSGGVSLLTSSLAIYNEILSTRPDLLGPLYVGAPYTRKGQQLPGEAPVTPYNVPVFCAVDGQVSCRYIRLQIERGAEESGVELAPKLVEALDYFDSLASRDDLQLRFTLEPGEILFLNNYTTLHGRTLFEDHSEPERKRHMLRLWLDVPQGRKVVPEMDLYNHAAAGGRGGIAGRVATAPPSRAN